MMKIDEIKLEDYKDITDLKNALVREGALINANKELTYRENRFKIKSAIEKIKNGDAVYLGAYENGKLIALCGITRKSGNSSHRAELGVFVHKDFRNKGIGTRLIKRAIELAKKRLKGLEIIELEVSDRNEPAIHVYEKVGFKKVAELKNALKVRGEHHNLYVMYYLC